MISKCLILIVLKSQKSYKKNSINKDISFLFVGYYSFEKKFYNNVILEKYSIEYINKPINGFSLQTKIDKYVNFS